MRNAAVEALDMLVGDWTLTLTNAWFLESLDETQYGRASARWLGDAFVELEAELGGEPTWRFVFGSNDPEEQLIALYHDPRPTSRRFHMEFGNGEWTMLREDPDFHQRFLATVASDRIEGHWDASDDAGITWRKDFDLIFDRVKPDPR
jgi:hypothetical protein